ncbi:MAG: RNA-binding transcriptional accessory protein, partial [Gammaproteobacteria bacterium]|nr:RNA-binding transcriptional accessory protein [Gammaproteobacteria bacterium]
MLNQSAITHQIAVELNVRPEQVKSAAQLLDAGDTVPFISRYRKEATGGLTDTDLRTLEERLAYLRELEERRVIILKSIEEQGKLTPELSLAIQSADSKARLEDLYLPYKQKRRTKAQIAREAGLDPLAQALLADPTLEPEKTAEAYINVDLNVPDIKTALEGARFILMEQFSEEANLLGLLRDKLWEEGTLTSQVVTGKEEAGEKFRDYFQYSEMLKKVPSHRMLAILRGRQETFLQVTIA